MVMKDYPDAKKKLESDLNETISKFMKFVSNNENT